MPVSNEDLVKQAYASIGRSGVGTTPGQIDQGGYQFWIDALNNGTLNEKSLNDSFGGAVDQYMVEKSNDPIENYVANFLVDSAYEDLGRTGIGTDVSQVDQGGHDFWTDAITSGKVSATDFGNQFKKAVDNYIVTKPDDRYTKYVANSLSTKPNTSGDFLGSGNYDSYLKKQTSPITATPSNPVLYKKTTGIGAAGDALMGAGDADYESSLIKELRDSSNDLVSNNKGFTSYSLPETTSSGNLPLNSGGAFNPDVLTQDAASADDVENWNNYSTYRTNSLTAKSPIDSFSKWLTAGKVSGIPAAITE